MKLYLSSYRVPTPNDLLALLGKPAADCKVAIIPHAKDYYTDRIRQIKIGDVAGSLRLLGFTAEVVDLANLHDAEEVTSALASHDLIWAAGGNTFMLRHQMRRSGFDQAIGLLVEGGKVYGGESAGAVVAGKTLKGVEYADDPRFTEALIEEGLGLIDKVIVPHVDSPGYAAGTEEMISLHKDDPALVQLKDNQALVIDGDNQAITTGA